MKFVVLFIILFIFSCSNKSGESDPCDAMCDNCFNVEQCNECYENCYNGR